MITPNPADPVFLCFTAAWIDTEGSIGLTAAKPGKSPRHANQNVRYRQRVSVTQTSRVPLDLLCAAWGGRVLAYDPGDGFRKVRYDWIVTDQAAAHMLEAIRSYMVLKGPQADVVIEAASLLRGSRGTFNRWNPRPPEITARLASLKEKIHELNGYTDVRRSRAKHDRFGAKPSDRWSQHHDACIACGRTDLYHAGHGYCRNCYQKHVVRPRKRTHTA